MNTFIHLTGYYPSIHPIIIRRDAVTSIEQNVINENSQGSTIFAGGAPFQVLEEPTQVLALINPS
jgi:hypothetical protein